MGYDDWFGNDDYGPGWKKPFIIKIPISSLWRWWKKRKRNELATKVGYKENSQEDKKEN